MSNNDGLVQEARDGDRNCGVTSGRDQPWRDLDVLALQVEVYPTRMSFTNGGWSLTGDIFNE